MLENVYKAAETKDTEFIAYSMGMLAAMSLQLGDAYYILKLKSQAVKSLLSAEGNEDVFKALKHKNPAEFKQYVDDVRRAGVSDEVLHYMAWKEGDLGFYVPATKAKEFNKAFEENYKIEYTDLKYDNPDMSESKLKQSAKNAAAQATQKMYGAETIDLTDILKLKK